MQNNILAERRKHWPLQIMLWLKCLRDVYAEEEVHCDGNSENEGDVNLLPNNPENSANLAITSVRGRFKSQVHGSHVLHLTRYDM